MAIGATRKCIVSMIFAQAFRLSAIGVIAGVMEALALTRFLASLLYGVGTTDVAYVCNGDFVGGLRRSDRGGHPGLESCPRRSRSVIKS